MPEENQGGRGRNNDASYSHCHVREESPSSWKRRSGISSERKGRTIVRAFTVNSLSTIASFLQQQPRTSRRTPTSAIPTPILSDFDHPTIPWDHSAEKTRMIMALRDGRIPLDCKDRYGSQETAVLQKIAANEKGVQARVNCLSMLYWLFLVVYIMLFSFLSSCWICNFSEIIEVDVDNPFNNGSVAVFSLMGIEGNNEVDNHQE